MSLTNITGREFAAMVCGEEAVRAHSVVHTFYARNARIFRDVIARDLNGALSTQGKEFLATKLGRYRVMVGGNGDNSTEARVHEEMGAKIVQALGEISPANEERGAITLRHLYELHGMELNDGEFLAKVARRHGIEAGRSQLTEP